MDRNQLPAARRAFLSYARVDRPRVARLVAALGAAGVAVWWDAAIDAGTVFHDRIAAELEQADVVVVVWSHASIGSQWVRDEAGVGARRGCLLPVMIDAVQPPLGFRQLHAIDLTGWAGDAGDPALGDLVRAIDGRAAAAPAPRPAPAAWRARPWRIGIAALVALAVVAAALFVGWPRPGSADPGKPIVAVLPFEQLSDGVDAAYFAKGLAEEILDTLGADPRFKVLGRTTSQVIGEQQHAEPGFARQRLGVTQLVEGSVRGGSPAGDKRVKVSVRLIDTKDGAELWGQSFDRHGTDLIAMQEEIARAVAARIGGAPHAAPLAAAPRPVPAEAYEKTLVARQLIHDRQAAALSRARDLAAAAIALAPDYAPPYATRALVTALLTRYADVPAAALADARADAYDALSVTLWLQGQLQPALAASRRAIELRPRNAEAHLHLAAIYSDVGEPRRAAAEFGVASTLDPLWVVPVASVIETYGTMGDAVSIAALARQFRTLSVDATSIVMVDAYAAEMLGSYGAALNLVTGLLAHDAGVTIASQLRDRVRAALFAAPAGGGAAGGGDWPTDYDSAVARDHSYGLLAAGRDAALVHGFTARFGSVAAYRAALGARLDIATTVALAVALDRRGAAGDAGVLRAAAGDRIAAVEAAGVDPAENAVSRAGLLLAAGNRAAALRTLDLGVTRRWWAVCRGPWWIATLPTLARLRHDPHFATLVATCRSQIDAQRRLAGLAPATLE